MAKPMAFGERLRSFREARQWSVLELEKRSGLKSMSIYKLEWGMRRHPRLETLIALADAFGITLEELTGHRTKKGKK